MAIEATTVGEFIRAGAAALQAADLSFGHGTDNPVDDAAELVFYAVGLRHEDATQAYPRVLAPEERDAVNRLFSRRIDERLPTAYLTHRMWFAGHEFYVDERVLVPRSPIAELIESAFVPWVEPDAVRNVVDIGTGSGCIAIATALVLPDAIVDAADVSPAALAVTQLNIERLGVGQRVRPIQSDVYASLGSRRYDIIVSNPPYVSLAEMAELPDEYLKEPELGLASGADGLDVVRRLLVGAADHLHPEGILVVEVGDSESTLVAACPDVPFTWLDFERGGGGVFLLTAAQLREYRPALQRLARGIG